MRLRSRTPAILATAVGIAALVIAATGVAQTSHTRATAIHRYTPFVGGRIAPGVTVARTVSGSCAAPSSADTTTNAYRCTVRSLIYDPCFVDKTRAPSYVLCPLYTPHSKVLRIKLNRPLSSNLAPTSAGDPWALQTTGGTWCKRYTGPSYRVLGKPITYLCRAGYILEEPQRGSTWTALFAPGYKTVNRPRDSYRRVNLASAWW